MLSNIKVAGILTQSNKVAIALHHVCVDPCRYMMLLLFQCTYASKAWTVDNSLNFWTIVLFPAWFISHMWGVFIPLWDNHLCLTDIRRFSCGVVDVTHLAPQSIILFWNVKLPTYFHAPLIWQLMCSFFLLLFLEHWWYSPIWRTQEGMCYVMC